MKKQFQNDSGMTLVEILAALVLLSIVLLAFFSFFTQSAKFTQHNKEKLTAVEVAEDVVALLRANMDLDELEEYEVNGDTYLNTTSYPSYKVEIKVNNELPELKLSKATIKVEPISVDSIKRSPFTTEMYFEVTQ